MPLFPIVITGVGHIPSFKNHKRICKNRLIVDPKVGRKMKRITQLITSALRLNFQTDVYGMPTAPSLPSWIASSVPLDDSVAWLPSISVNVEYVPEGQEGALIQITKIKHDPA